MLRFDGCSFNQDILRGDALLSKHEYYAFNLTVVLDEAKQI